MHASPRRSCAATPSVSSVSRVIAEINNAKPTRTSGGGTYDGVAVGDAPADSDAEPDAVVVGLADVDGDTVTDALADGDVDCDADADAVEDDDVENDRVAVADGEDDAPAAAPRKTPRRKPGDPTLF